MPGSPSTTRIESGRASAIDRLRQLAGAADEARARGRRTYLGTPWLHARDLRTGHPDGPTLGTRWHRGSSGYPGHGTATSRPVRAVPGVSAAAYLILCSVPSGPKIGPIR